MSAEIILDLLREAFWLTLLWVAVLILPSLLVGLLVAVFQAATQINEQTLSFLPRLLMILLTLILAGPWLVGQLMEFSENLISNIPQIIG
ncbi:flagellar biosynthetic protein FliQ [Ventosimonas gracilis]|uniref:Flagellar biosynthetic protein FliQ n=1 Tax=Ventosimonas gracilis TaxID=1680762 RepID=A0A139SU65_9GAMM|nr:flagellar biosynthesis protein FliQ [Ventosimonas gracilis]KXU38129.1 flagellar biosynthetic protein FliQ [Ventosimonas gracilis]